MAINTSLQHWATLRRNPMRHAGSERLVSPFLPTGPHDRGFKTPLPERVSLVLLAAVLMAVCVGGLAFTGFVGYMALR